MSKDFIWTDELKEEYINSLEKILLQNGRFPHLIREKFVASHQPKEIIQNKDWEIVKMVHPKTKETVGDGSPFDNETIRQKTIGSMKEWNIISVKRLSDGEVFSVGDEVRVYRDSGYKGDRKLLSFFINKHGELRVVHEGSDSSIYQISKLPSNKQEPKEGFVWTDELVKEFVIGATKVQQLIPHDVSIERGIYHFKKEKQSKQPSNG